MRLRAMLWKANILRVETLHAALRRRIYMKSVQTHGQSYEELCAEWCIDRARLRNLSTFLRENGICVPIVVGHRDAPESFLSDSDVVAALRTRKRSTWDAHTHLEQFNTTGGLTSREKLSESYKARTPEQNQKLLRLTDAANLVLSTSGGDAAPFGGKARERNAKVKEAQDEIACRALALRTPTRMAPHDVAERAALAASCSGARDLEAMLCMAESEVRLVAKQRRMEREQDKLAVQSWESTIGREQIRKLVAAVPDLKPLANILEPIPSDGDLMVQVRGSVREASQMAGIADAVPHAPATIEASFRTACRIVMHGECPPILDAKEKVTFTDTCERVGRCICSGEGLIVRRMFNGFLKALKAAFKSKAGRDHLRNRDVVCLFEGICEGGFANKYEEKLAKLSGKATQAQHIVTWASIGHHNFSPYKPTFKLLEEDDTATPYPGTVGETHLQASSIIYVHTFRAAPRVGGITL
jgi:hypothetical protein